MIKITQKGDFSKTEAFLHRDRNAVILNILEQYGQIGVTELMKVTPVRTGKTQASWYYTVKKTASGFEIDFNNSNRDKDGTPVVILLKFGHGTQSGAYVPPNDFVTPAIRPVLESIGDKAWEEVTASGKH